MEFFGQYLRVIFATVGKGVNNGNWCGAEEVRK